MCKVSKVVCELREYKMRQVSRVVCKREYKVRKVSKVVCTLSEYKVREISKVVCMLFEYKMCKVSVMWYVSVSIKCIR